MLQSQQFIKIFPQNADILSTFFMLSILVSCHLSRKCVKYCHLWTSYDFNKPHFHLKWLNIKNLNKQKNYYKRKLVLFHSSLKIRTVQSNAEKWNTLNSIIHTHTHTNYAVGYMISYLYPSTQNCIIWNYNTFSFHLTSLA